MSTLGELLGSLFEKRVVIFEAVKIWGRRGKLELAKCS